MAWFKKEDKKPVAPLTIERVANVLKENEYTFDMGMHGEIFSGFCGNSMVIRLMLDGEVLSVTSYATGAYLPEDRLQEMLTWANSSNMVTFLGTVCVTVDDEKDAILRVETNQYAGRGLSDKQIDMLLHTAISANDSTIKDYLEAFGIERKSPEEEEDEA